MENYLNSSVIKMYPSQSRNDYWDRQSKMTNEQNLISVVNRIVGKKSFIVDGLKISENGKTLESGVCNIAGYLFNINTGINLEEPASVDSKLYLGIRVQKYKVSDNGIYTQLEKLLPWDGNALDSSTDPTASFKGLKITDRAETTTSSEYENIYLQIAVADGTTKWKSVMSDVTSINNTLATRNTAEFNINTNDIRVDNSNSVSKENSKTNDTLSLDWYLKNYYSIDDGDLG